MTELRELPTPQGPGRLHVDPARGAAGERVRLLLGHGAGGGVEAPDLLALAARLPDDGVTVVRLEQPWRVAGRKLAGRPATLDQALHAAIDALPDTAAPLVLAGRSAGARSACRVAAQQGSGSHQPSAAGVICLAFPLHPPGKGGDPEKSRGGEPAGVIAAGVPLHVVQGSRDAFGSDEDVRAVLDPRRGEAAGVVHGIPLADHSFVVPKRAGAAAGTSTEQALDQVVEAVSHALAAILEGGSSE